MCDSVKEKLLLQELEMYKTKVKALEVELEYKDSYIELLKEEKRQCEEKLGKQKSVSTEVFFNLEKDCFKPVCTVTDDWTVDVMCDKLRQSYRLDLSKVTYPDKIRQELSSKWGNYRKLYNLPKLSVKDYLVKMK